MARKGMMLKTAKEQLAEAKRHNKREVEAMVKATRRLVKSLKKLDKEQVASVIALLLMIDGSLRACAGMKRLEERMITQITNNLKPVSPKLQFAAKAILESSRAGRDEEFVYQRTVFKCALAGKAKTKCPEAVAAKARWIGRMSEELVLVRNRINLLWNRLGLTETAPMPI